MDFRLSAEQKSLVEVAARIGASYEHDDETTYPYPFARRLAQHGFTGIALSEADGGQGATLLDAILVLEAVTMAEPRAGDVVQATNFAAIRQIAALGSSEIKDRYLRPVLAGEAVTSVAISESSAGSSVTEMRATARTDGDEVVVKAAKLFNTNGPHATHYVVWARFSEGRNGIGAVIVDDTTPGFGRGKTEHYLSGEAHCALFFDDCRVPRANALSESGGLRRLLPIFNVERLGNATRSLACGQRAFDLAVAHLNERRQFGRRLADNQGLRWKLAEVKARLDGARLLLYRAAIDLTDGFPDGTNASIAKYACNTAGYEAANEAVQCFGGYGVSTEYPVAFLLARTREWMIAGGTLEMLRDRIADGIFGRIERAPDARG